MVVCLLGLVLACPTARASTLFALVNSGELYTSVDGGVTWTASSALPVPDAAGLIAGNQPTDLYLASGSGVIYRSPDAGTTWNAVGTVPASDVTDLAARTDGAILALTRSGTLWISTDQGASFSGLASLGASDLVSLVREGDGTILAVTQTGTVRRSVDGGSTWTAVGTVPSSDVEEVRQGGAAVYLLTEAGLVYRSLDQGGTWTAVGSVGQVGMRGMVEYQGELVAIERGGLTARSTDGVNWAWVGALNQVEVVALANDVPQAVGVPEQPEVPAGLILAPPVPNPARAGEDILVRFAVPVEDRVRLDLFDVNGRRVRSRPWFEALAGGNGRIRWNPGPLPPGVYRLRIAREGGGTASRTVVILP